MDIGTLLVALIRLIHIVAAFLWFGLATAQTFFIMPAAAAAGESGLRFMKVLNTRTSISKALPAAGGITVLAGIVLYLLGARNHFTTTGNIVLAIGAIAGLIEAIHGGAVIGRASTAMTQALETYVVDNQPISSEGVGILRKMGTELRPHAQLGFTLMMIALIGMGSARYL